MIKFIIVIMLIVLNYLMLTIFEKIITRIERNHFKRWAKENEYNFIYSKFLEYERENKWWN